MPGNFVTIVSGLPRSGTSLLMQMLAAGGMQVITDGQRAADQHNPRGYFELEAVKHTRTDHSWLTRAEGKAVKVVHLLLPHLPSDREYRVIFMQRDLSEIIASQRAMLQQQGRPAAKLPDSKLAEIFGNQLSQVRQWLSQIPQFPSPASSTPGRYRDAFGRSTADRHLPGWRLGSQTNGCGGGTRSIPSSPQVTSVVSDRCKRRARVSCLSGELSGRTPPVAEVAGQY